MLKQLRSILRINAIQTEQFYILKYKNKLKEKERQTLPRMILFTGNKYQM